ncbi:hypothetical protein HOLleu_12500 [Holothuria leucospilota]|uniref:Uncharacterized protein n=1 Tax=Holothuria leucospilota TaxID=206669 RepID=A0A9Q1C9B9_HOLLE|nr:hypothetical protein HOLleu_12500 [Holothuria leucospilota]
MPPFRLEGPVQSKMDEWDECTSVSSTAEQRKYPSEALKLPTFLPLEDHFCLSIVILPGGEKRKVLVSSFKRAPLPLLVLESQKGKFPGALTVWSQFKTVGMGSGLVRQSVSFLWQQ